MKSDIFKEHIAEGMREFQTFMISMTSLVTILQNCD